MKVWRACIVTEEMGSVNRWATSKLEAQKEGREYAAEDPETRQFTGVEAIYIPTSRPESLVRWLNIFVETNNA